MNDDYERIVEGFTAELQPAGRVTVRRLADIIIGTGHPLDVAVKWHRLTFAREGDFHHWIAGIAVTKKAIVLVFHFGGLLNDPDCRFRAGSSKFGRHLDYASPGDVDDTIVRGFVDQAVASLPYFRENWKSIQAAG